MNLKKKKSTLPRSDNNVMSVVLGDIMQKTVIYSGKNKHPRQFMEKFWPKTTNNNGGLIFELLHHNVFFSGGLLQNKISPSWQEISLRGGHSYKIS